jgi:signal transduction histidine kinase
MQQLFSNLLINALKYSKKSTVPVVEIKYLKVKAQEEPYLSKATKQHYHKITFTDNGIGFEQKYADQIFELFNRLHNKQDYTGTGVGLSICKKIIDNHQGFIFAEGKLQVGATFIIYLPV